MFADRRSIMTNANPSSVDRFADLKQLYAEAIATPEFQAAFGDPIPLSIVSAGDEPTDLDMPEPFAAQAECGGVIAAIFDLFTDTRLDAFAPDIAWGFVTPFHFTAGKLARRDRSDKHTSELLSLTSISYAAI